MTEEAWRQHHVSEAALQRSLCYRPGVACAVADMVPVTVLISGQLQVSHWRLPVSVPFANFSSQDRHKTHGTPAAVHSNPVLSMSLYHTWERQPASVWLWFGASIQEALTHGAGEPKALGCLCVFFAVHTTLFHHGRSCEMWLLCYYKNRLSEADVIVGGRSHMLCVKEPHSHATLSRNDVKIASLPRCQRCRGWKYVTLWRKRDPDYLMIRPFQFANRMVYEMWEMMLSKFSFYGLFSGQFYQLFHRTHWKTVWRPADGMRGNYPSLQMN